MIDGRTCRAARGFLDWTSRTLAAKSGVPVSRIFELERNRPIGEAHRRALESAFLQHGVLIAYDGTRPVGIRDAPGLEHAIAMRGATSALDGLAGASRAALEADGDTVPRHGSDTSS